MGGKKGINCVDSMKLGQHQRNSTPICSITQLSINGVGLTKPLNTSLNPTSKHSSHLRKPIKVVGRGELGITGYQPNIDTYENNSNRFRTNLDPFIGVLGFPVETIIKADTKLTVVICCHLFD